MPTAAIIGPRGFARLSATAFLATALALIATAAYVDFVGAGRALTGVLLAIAAACAVCAGAVLRAGRKADTHRAAAPAVHRAPASEPQQLEIFPVPPDDDRPEQRD